MSIDLGYVSPAPPPSQGRRRAARWWLVGGSVAVAVAGAVAVASIASAHTGTQAQTPAAPAASASSGPGQVPHRGGPMMRGGFGFGPGLGQALHGEYVTAKPGGGYQTIDMQQGQVTAVSSTSITVKSDDGFTKSYTVTANTLVDAQRDGIGSVKAGDRVSVLATAGGATATATDIRDRTQFQAVHPRAPKPSPTQ